MYITLLKKVVFTLMGNPVKSSSIFHRDNREETPSLMVKRQGLRPLKPLFLVYTKIPWDVKMIQ